MEIGIVGGLLGMVFALVCFAIGASHADGMIEKLKQEAIERGYAEWELVGNKGETEFKWK